MLQDTTEVAGVRLLMLESLLFRLYALGRGPCPLRLQDRWAVCRLQETVEVCVQAAPLLDWAGEVAHALALRIRVTKNLNARFLCVFL